MKKTGGNIETDIYNLLSSGLKTICSTGNVYKSEGRGKNATTEDAVVIFMGGLDDQVQEGIVTVNIFINDIDNGTGTKVKDAGTCRSVESSLLSLIDSATTTEYELTRKSIIQTFAVEEIDQHFVNAKIQFKRITI
jgi:hypothetical protein